MMKRYLPSLGFVYLVCLFMGAFFFIQWIRSPFIVPSAPVEGDIFSGMNVASWKVTNFEPLEGPYPQWDLPRVRWGGGTESSVEFLSRGAGEVNMAFRVRTFIEDQEMEISLNNKTIRKVHVRSDLKKGEFQEVPAKGVLKKGRNKLVLDYSTCEKKGHRCLAVMFSLVRVGPGDFIVHKRAGEKGIDKRDIFRSDSVEFGNFSGLGGLEGPYPKLKLPKVRWGLGPETNIAVIAKKQRQANIALWTGTHIKGQTIEIVVNGQPAKRTLVKEGKLHVIHVPVRLKEGDNVVTLRYSKWVQADITREGPVALLFSKIEIE